MSDELKAMADALEPIVEHQRKLKAENDGLKAQLAEALADQRRLEWLVHAECFVSWLTPHECYVADVAGLMEAPASSIGWRDAIDKVMAHTALDEIQGITESEYSEGAK